MFNTRTLTAILSLIFLSACAQQPSSKTEAARAEEKAAIAATNAEIAAKQAIFPLTISFASTSTKLDQPSLDAIAEASKQLPASAKIIITGYADKKLGNAKNRALARGIAVKSALIKNGVTAKSIRVKYFTTQPKNEAIIALNE